MVVHRFPSRQGGAERQVESLAPLLVERGVDLNVVSRTHPDSSPVFEHADVHHVPIRGGRLRRSTGFVTRAVSQIRSTRPDVVHAHGLLSPSTAAIVAARSMGTPVIAKVLLGGANGEIERLRSWRRLGPPRLRAITRLVDRFVVISDEIDAELEALGVAAGRRAFVPNGVDLTRFQPADPSNRAESRARLGLGEAPVVLFVGRLNPQKGLTALLEAWNIVKRCHPDASLLVVGEGDMRTTLEAATNEGVRVVGQVDDVRPYLAAADVFVLPSNAEGLSNALLEAMAAGLAIVATTVGATPSVLGDAGLLVAPGDVSALASALEHMLSDEPLRRATGGSARARVEAQYPLALTADRLVMLYRELVDSR